MGAIADVRRFPGLRRSPHFARQSLAQTLPEHGIGYVWIPELGGRRRRARDAPPSAWQVEAFAAYADHLRSTEFRAGFDRVLEMMAARPTAIMCARLRRIVATDVDLRWAELHGVEVVHIVGEHRRASPGDALRAPRR